MVSGLGMRFGMCMYVHKRLCMSVVCLCGVCLCGVCLRGVHV